MKRSTISRAIAALPIGCLLAACHKPVQMGTLPRIEIPIEAEPAPAPTTPEPGPEKEEPRALMEHDLPDPPAARHADQVELVLQFRAGAARIVRARQLRLAEPRTTARRVGRFAVELWSGAELLERVRFDFPLLGAEEEDGPFEPGLETEAVVLLPDLERPTLLRVLDRRTRTEHLYRWPVESDGGEPLDSETPAASVAPEDSPEPSAESEPEG